MAAKITSEDEVILIEIGGNDLIAGIPSSQFGRSLEAILQKVSAPGRTVIMFELPLLPDRIAYEDSAATRENVWRLADPEAILHQRYRWRERDLRWAASFARRDMSDGDSGGGGHRAGSETHARPPKA